MGDDAAEATAWYVDAGRLRVEAAQALLKGKHGLDACANGLRVAGCRCGGGGGGQTCAPVDPVQVGRLCAVNAAQLFEPTRHFGRQMSSYALKHIVERSGLTPEGGWPRGGHPYWSNGAFILYMVSEGFEVEPVSAGDSPNAFVKCKPKRE